MDPPTSSSFAEEKAPLLPPPQHGGRAIPDARSLRSSVACQRLAAFSRGALAVSRPTTGIKGVSRCLVRRPESANASFGSAQELARPARRAASSSTAEAISRPSMRPSETSSCSMLTSMSGSTTYKAASQVDQ